MQKLRKVTNYLNTHKVGLLLCGGVLAVLTGAIPLLHSQGPTVHSAVMNVTEPAGTVVTGYNLYRSTVAGGPYAKVATQATTAVTATLTDNTVVGGTTYFFVATALNQTSESGPGPEKSGTTGPLNPPPPGEPSLVIN